ncbi:unnamed protein product [Caenorhabditis auriculariae]|uniref:leucine--tRNA ligase n=1 Tax=Caenorhabditis auriculariae TaxID=2777116 RepID=A0A8S1GSR1_9PELO|nr:unnamed protein product [Caenorhabditis auriculariae]
MRRASRALRGHAVVPSTSFRFSSALQWPSENIRISENIKLLEEFWAERLQEQFKQAKSDYMLMLISYLSSVGNGKKRYILSMFPYPSGRLHMGHMRVYTISDVSARYYRLNGFKVIHPIGWDSFGLPAENAARERGVDPREWTLQNISAMREQLTKTGVLFDWEREISTCDPQFYRWTQWLFCKLHEKKLIRRSLSEVNWDPVDQTVLAAEQIDNEGRSWRSGAKAEKRKLRQWMVETPRYAKALHDGLKDLAPQWKEVADIQSNWIGRCDVFRFLLPVNNKDTGAKLDEQLDLRIKEIRQISQTFFLVLRQSHPFADVSKKGIDEPYQLPISVLNGVTGQWMDVVVAPDDYQKNAEFHLDVRPGDPKIDDVLISTFGLKSSRKDLSMNKNDVQEIASFGGYGGYETSRTLQDWVVSRQRGWGTPIPMILSRDGTAAVPVKYEDLPLLQGNGGVEVDCSRLAGGKGVLESDTLDTFFDSSWYYLRYLDPKNNHEIVSKNALSGMPVDLYVGGIEHAAVHMFFARFISYFLNNIGVTEVKEPFVDLIPQGIVRGKTFVEKNSRRYLKPEEIVGDDKLKTTSGEDVEVVFEKMSKSKNNGIDPLVVLERDGVDLTRLQLLDAAAPRAPINWGDSDLKGIKKWLDRTANVVSKFVAARKTGSLPKSVENVEKELKETYNFFVRNVSMCLEVLHLHNTALARLQGFTNSLRKMKSEDLAASQEGERCLKALIIMIEVFAPHVSAELWSALETVTSSAEKRWPQVDEDAKIDFMLMVDGVSCGRLAVDRREVEGRTVEETLRRAQRVEHKLVLQKLAEAGLKTQSVTQSERLGFHMTLNMKLQGDSGVNAKKFRRFWMRYKLSDEKEVKGVKKNKEKKESY